MRRQTYPDFALSAVGRRHGGRPPAGPDAGSVQQAAGAEPASDPPHPKGGDGRSHGDEAHEEEGGGGRDDGGEGRWTHPWIVGIGVECKSVRGIDRVCTLSKGPEHPGHPNGTASRRR